MSVRTADSVAPQPRELFPHRSRLHQVLAVGTQAASVAGEPRLRPRPAGGCPKCPPCDADADRQLVLAEDAYDAIIDQMEELKAEYAAKMKGGRFGRTYKEKMVINYELKAALGKMVPMRDAALDAMKRAGALVKAVSPPGRFDAIQATRARLRKAIDDLKEAEEELERHLKLRYHWPEKTKQLKAAVERAQREVHAAEAERRKYL